MEDSFFERVLGYCDKSLLSEVRTHLLRTYCSENLKMFVLRDDESGFGLSGSKKRKYASLIPWLVKMKYTEVALIGGGNSNHIAAILQLLNENQIIAHLFLKKAHQNRLVGNRWLIELLADDSTIHWVEPEKWDEAESWVRRQKGPDIFVIPEGGSCKQSLPGACTLSREIYRSQEYPNRQYDHIFIDAGTGMIAAATALTLTKTRHRAQLHVVLIAGDKASWEYQLKQMSSWWEELFDEKAPEPVLVRLHFPPTAKSFGAVNASVWKVIRKLAREEGVLTDPVYSAKLFLTVKELMREENLSGNGLIVHSGGGIGLMGHAPQSPF